MEQQSVSSVPVVNNTDRSWRGLVLLRDLLPLRERKSGFGRTTAARVARGELSLAPTDSLAVALERMREHESAACRSWTARRWSGRSHALPPAPRSTAR